MLIMMWSELCRLGVRCSMSITVFAAVSCFTMLVYISMFFNRCHDNSCLHATIIQQSHTQRRISLITSDDLTIARRLDTLVKRRADASDPDLIQLIRDMMHLPSNHMVKMSRLLMNTPQSREIDHIFKKKTKGFFVECGALDGERSSNTLFLEFKRNWTGLLLEMDPYFYTQLLGKSRNSWSINACLSPKPYVTQLAYKESSAGTGKLLSSEPESYEKLSSGMVPCFPLHALLTALNRSQVDYFSLDVEGYELDILRTIPFDKVNIRTLSVEYLHGRQGKQAYIEFMGQQGYYVHKDIYVRNKAQSLSVDDFIFIKRQTSNTSSAYYRL